MFITAKTAKERKKKKSGEFGTKLSNFFNARLGQPTMAVRRPEAAVSFGWGKMEKRIHSEAFFRSANGTPQTRFYKGRIFFPLFGKKKSKSPRNVTIFFREVLGCTGRLPDFFEYF